MNTIDDAQIREIVQRVLGNALGLPQQDTAPAVAPASAAVNTPDQAGAETRKVVAIGADHGGFDLKETIKPLLVELGYGVRDVGAFDKNAVDYPDLAHQVAKLVAGGTAWRGIMIDGAGIGSCVAANKVPGVRAGLAYDLSSAINGREHNDTNLLTLGAGLIGVALAKQIVKAWLGTEHAGGRHAARVAKIAAIEQQYLKN